MERVEALPDPADTAPDDLAVVERMLKGALLVRFSVKKNSSQLKTSLADLKQQGDAEAKAIKRAERLLLGQAATSGLADLDGCGSHDECYQAIRALHSVCATVELLEDLRHASQLVGIPTRDLHAEDVL
mgnify:CR=1 FL=1